MFTLIIAIFAFLLITEFATWMTYGSLHLDVDKEKIDLDEYKFSQFIESRKILFHRGFQDTIIKLPFNLLSKYAFMDEYRIPRWSKLSKALDVKFKG